MRSVLTLAFVASIAYLTFSQSQDAFTYNVALKPLSLPGLPGLHSFAWAQHGGKWLIVGGRRDGIHARQPFNAFPAAQNNDRIYVVDPQSRSVWSQGLENLPTGLHEQMQSSNMNFIQEGEVLYLVGGYAYSPSLGDHRTFPYLTRIDVPGLMQAVVDQTPLSPHAFQISNDFFAVTGGYLGQLDDRLYLVGGHRFDGRYNPHGPNHGPGFSQIYTNQIRRFRPTFVDGQLGFEAADTQTDAVHLHRRDYNLVPQIYPDGKKGLLISSGVFQPDADLPFLYPVEIREDGYTPITGFNQYLSNYHAAHFAAYDSLNAQMHTLFLGGISRYYYQNGQLIEDDQVPFVRTISRLTRYADGSYAEFALSEQMPGLLGASAEFIPNTLTPQFASKILNLNALPDNDTILVGHVVGGLQSLSLNPFSNNQIQQTSASATLYEVKLYPTKSSAVVEVQGAHGFGFTLSPNPNSGQVLLEIQAPQSGRIDYQLSTADGKRMGAFLAQVPAGESKVRLDLTGMTNQSFAWLTLSLDQRFFATQKIVFSR